MPVTGHTHQPEPSAARTSRALATWNGVAIVVCKGASMSSDNAEPATAPIREPLVLTWTFTETYRHGVPLDAVAAATGRDPLELAADPALLIGVVGDRLADLLTDRQSPERAVGVPEVEIVSADYANSPTLAELVYAGRVALLAEADANQSGVAGRALAALLAGLRREGIDEL
jgi:hypothetical protein